MTQEAFDAAIGPAAGSRLRLDFVDGVRGVAAFFVLVHHCWLYAVENGVEAPPMWFRSLTVFKFGTYGVAVFIVVSGYCLMLPTLRRKEAWGARGIKRFAGRRARRILPPYMVALGLSMILFAVDGRYRDSIPFSPGFTPGNVLSHLALVHNWSREWRWAFDPPLWTTALEFQIYFVFALVLLPVWRRFGSTATFGAAIALATVVILAGADFTSPWMVIMFVMGMAAAKTGTAEAGGSSWTYRALTGALVVAVLVITVLRNQTEDMVNELTVGAATAFALIVMSQVSVRGGNGGFVQRLLSSPPARALGLISFSLYLVHYPIVRTLGAHWQVHMNVDAENMFLFLLVVAVPVSLLVAVAFYLCVERRFLNYRPEPIRATPPAPALGRPGGASS